MILSQTLSHEHSLPLTAGQPAQVAGSQVGDAHTLQNFVDPGTVRGAKPAIEAGVCVPAHRHHLPDRHRERVVDLGRLQNVRETIGLTVHLDYARPGLDQSCDRVENG